MKKLNYALMLMFITLTIVSCSKSEWKKSTEVAFLVDVNKEASMDGKLFFTEGQIVLRNITFDGKRIQADDVYFEADFDKGLKVALSSTTANSSLVFDIPQGTYSSVRIDFEAEESDDELIIIKGFYTNSSGIELPIIIELIEIEFYDKIAKTAQGEVEIDLVAGNPKKATIILDPIFWFGTFSLNQLDNAETTLVNGVETILINEENNESLHNIIEDRIGANEKVTFN